MSNGAVCCMLGWCCDRPQAKKKLAEELDRQFGLSAEPKGVNPGDEGESIGTGTAVAEWLLDNFDLAPLGFTRYVIDGIAPHLKHKFDRDADG